MSYMSIEVITKDEILNFHDIISFALWVRDVIKFPHHIGIWDVHFYYLTSIKLSKIVLSDLINAPHLRNITFHSCIYGDRQIEKPKIKYFLNVNVLLKNK